MEEIVNSEDNEYSDDSDISPQNISRPISSKSEENNFSDEEI